MSELNRRQVIGAAAAVAGGLAAASGRAEAAEKGEELPTFRYALEQQKGRITEGGYAREATVKQLPISTGLAGVSMRLKPGGLRELHWHPHANEWLYFISGKARMGLFGSHGRYRAEDFNTGDAGYIPQGFGHSIENVGGQKARILIVFNSGHYQTIDLSQWIAGNPADILATNFSVDSSVFDKFPHRDVFLTK